MNWNNIPDDERLRLWKNLRNDISKMQLQDQLSNVAKFFSTIPFGSRSLDYYSPSTWESPWEIIYHNNFCKSAISLLIFYTIQLLHQDIIVELILVDDGEDEYLLPIINATFVLNYELGQVNTSQDIIHELRIIATYTEKDIKTIS